MVSNGNFETDTSWFILVGDTISNGKLNISGQGARTSDTFLPVVGKNYLLTFDITDYTSGNIRAYDGSSGVDLSGDLNAIGSYSFSYTQSSTATDNLNFYAPIDFVGSISNVSVKEYYGEKTDTIKVNTIQECKYDPKKITFVNKFGALQDMYFFKKSVEKMTVKKESYKANIISSFGTYDKSNHVNRDFNIVSAESISLSSGFVSEEYNEVFKQMMLSEKVWITNVLDTGEQVLPINVKTSNITYKTSLNDKLVEYTIEFDKSYDVINNIR